MTTPSNESRSCKPSPKIGVSCQVCEHIDFPVLLTVDRVVDDRHGNALKKWLPKYNLADAAEFTAPERGAAALPPRRLKAAAAEFTTLERKGTLPCVRLPGAGFVYVFYQDRNRWDIWQSFSDGTYKMLLEHADADEYEQQHRDVDIEQKDSVCSRGAANVPAGLIALIGVHNQSSIWIGYARHLWLPEVLRAYQDNKQTRSQRMVEILIKDWLEGKPLPENGRVQPLSAALLEQSVPEFATLPSGRAQDGAPGHAGGRNVPPSSHPLQAVFAETDEPLGIQRIGQAQAVVQAAQRMEQSCKARDKALLVHLQDPVGVANAHNLIRLSVLREEQHWMGGGPDATGHNADPDRPWKHQSILMASYIDEYQVRRARENIGRLRRTKAVFKEHFISEQTYHQIMALEPGESWYPEGTVYTRLETQPVRYRVEFPETVIQQRQDEMANAQAKPRIDRYKTHLDMDRIENEKAAWLDQGRGWDALLLKRDEDYVNWLENVSLTTVLRHDHADRDIPSHCQIAPEKGWDAARNAANRIQDTDRCYGGGACTDASLKHLLGLMAKDESDPTHWYARSLIQDFGLLDPVRSTPSTTDLFDMAFASHDALDSFQQAWQEFKEPTQAARASLLLASNQAILRMLHLAKDPQAVKRLGIAPGTFAQAMSKHGLWVRASALHEFMDSGRKHYIVGVLWDMGDALKSIGASVELPTAVQLEPGGQKGGKTEGRKRKDGRKTLRELQTRLPKDATVYVVVDEKQLEAAASRRGGKMVDVVSHDLMGRPWTTRIPADTVDELLRAPRRELAQAKNNLLARGGPSLIAVVATVLQGWALWNSIERLTSRGGLEQIEAAAAVMSAVTGLAGGVFEIGAIALAQPELTTAGTPIAARVTGKLSLAVVFRLAAGYALSAGALFDGMAAFVRSKANSKDNNVAARDLFENQSAVQIVSFGSFLASSIISHLIARRTAQGVAVRMGVTLASTFIAASAIASWLTGVGLVLWLIGMGIGFYAMSKQHDVNEIWLRRSYFGKPPTQKEAEEKYRAEKFQSLEQELQAFCALSKSVVAEVEWHDALFGADQLGAKVMLPIGQEDQEATVAYDMSYVVEGFSALYSGRPTGFEHKDQVPLIRQDEQWVRVLEVALPDKLPAVRFTYTLYQQGKMMASDQLWIED